MQLDLENMFKYHAPTEDQVFRYGVLRDEAKLFAYAILEYAPESAERTLAIRKVQEAVMWANASIALNESKE